MKPFRRVNVLRKLFSGPAALLAAALVLTSCATQEEITPLESPEDAAMVPSRPGSTGTYASATARLRPAAQVNTDGIWYRSVPVSGPFIALTFDDGPHPSHTPRLLNILQEKGVKATFFVVGNRVVRHPGIVRRMAAEGHEIANHSWDHPTLTKLSVDGVHSQLERTHKAIADATGLRPVTLRPPYGAFNKSLADYAHREFGYKTIMWSVDPRDWADRNAAVVSRRILEATRSGSIVLAHDIHATTIDAMPATIDKLKAAGYRFVTVSQLISMENRGTASASGVMRPPRETISIAALAAPRQSWSAALSQ